MKYILVFISLLCMSGCTFEKVDPKPLTFTCDSSITISYEKDLIPIFDNSCDGAGVGSGCHDSWLFSYDAVIIRLEKLRNRTLELRDMPPPNNQFDIPALTPDELQKIECWIEAGAPDN